MKGICHIHRIFTGFAERFKVDLKWDAYTVEKLFSEKQKAVWTVKTV